MKSGRMCDYSFRLERVYTFSGIYKPNVLNNSFKGGFPKAQRRVIVCIQLQQYAEHETLHFQQTFPPEFYDADKTVCPEAELGNSTEF